MKYTKKKDLREDIMKRGKKQFLVLAAMLLFSCGCGNKEQNYLDPEEPAAITVWHAYNAVAKAKFDELVTEFNETVGMEKGIVVDTRGYGSSDELEDVLYASANHIIGSDPLPDIFTAYPEAAYRLDQEVSLVDLDQYFTEEEFSAYLPEFLEPGRWGEKNSHKMIPVAKSTELLYLNKTEWDRFSSETGTPRELLGTWEGMVQAAEAYWEWSGGKAFLGMNSYNDFMVLTAAQLGEEPYGTPENPGFSYSRETARKAWDACYVPHIKGWYASGVYNQDGIKSGKLAAYIGSSAGAGFFPEEVIVDEKHTYPVECECLPYPVFQGGEPYMTQRGADMAVIASEAKREYAAAVFLKWFTAPEQNMDFAVSTGYLPVEKAALESVSELSSHIDAVDNEEAIRCGLKASIDAMEQKRFHTRRPFKGSYRMNQAFSEALEQKTAEDLERMERRLDNGEDRTAIEAELLSEESFDQWYTSFGEEMAGIMDGEKE